MKKVFFVLIGVGVLLTAGFVAFNVIRFQSVEKVEQTDRPAVMPKDVTSDGQTMQVTMERQGSFIDGEKFYKGRGTVRQVTTADGRKVLQFTDFTVTNGPDLFVYLSKNPNATKDKAIGEFVSLGTLQKTSGDQVYNLPDNTSEYNAVFIWCRAFSVAFAVADLQ